MNSKLPHSRQHDKNRGIGSMQDQVSWFRPHLETSLALIERAAGGDRLSSIIDVGGGASTLVDDPIERGYKNLTVLDISQAAFSIAQNRLGIAARSVQWVEADVVQHIFPPRSFDVWHVGPSFTSLRRPRNGLHI